MELRSGKEIGGGFRQEKKQDEASPTIPIDVAAAGIHSSHEDVFVHRMEMIEDRLKVLDNLDDRLKKNRSARSATSVPRNYRRTTHNSLCGQSKDARGTWSSCSF